MEPLSDALKLVAQLFLKRIVMKETDAQQAVAKIIEKTGTENGIHCIHLLL